MLKRNFSSIVFGGGIIISLFFSKEDISSKMASMSSLKESLTENNQKTLHLEAQLEFEQEQAKIAEARYKKGCTVVVAAKDIKSLATLVEGEQIRDRTTKKPLPANTVVCDGNGNTAALINNKEGIPVIGKMAFTGNRELVLNQIKKIKGARVYFYTPEK